MSEIEPGDLIRDCRDKSVRIAEEALLCCTLLAKGPGWTRHDGSSVNPVPGAICQTFCGGNLAGIIGRSEIWHWPIVQFYRVTREAIPSQEELSAGRVVERFDPSPPPAPQPGWVATVTLEWATQSADDRTACVRIKWPNGRIEPVYRASVIDLPWQPPPPPPWEPEIGGRAWYHGMTYVVRDMHNDFAWCEDVDGDMYSIPVSGLSPPKGGAA